MSVAPSFVLDPMPNAFKVGMHPGATKYSVNRPHAAWWIAAQQGHARVLRDELVRLRKHVDARGDWGRTALWLAAANGQIECLRMLMEEGADVNVVDWADGNTALHMACRHGFYDVVLALVQEGGADFTIVNRDGRSPYMFAKLPLPFETARRMSELTRLEVELRRQNIALFLENIGGGSVALGRPIVQGIAVPNEVPEVVPRRVVTPKTAPASIRQSIPVMVPKKIEVLRWDDKTEEGGSYVKIDASRSTPSEESLSERFDDIEDRSISGPSEEYGRADEAWPCEPPEEQHSTGPVVTNGGELTTPTRVEEVRPLSARCPSDGNCRSASAPIIRSATLARITRALNEAVVVKRGIARRNSGSKKESSRWHGWCFGEVAPLPTVAPGMTLVRCPDGATSGDKVMVRNEGGVFEIKVPPGCSGEFFQMKTGKRSPEIFQLAPMVHIDALCAALASSQTLAATMSPQALRACSVKLVARGFETMDSLATLSSDELQNFVSCCTCDTHHYANCSQNRSLRLLFLFAAK
ncbi:MAG: hypothetical protein SGPRY_000209 [Prymnesium sp.]